MKYKYYYLYQITNLLNGKIYIGVHRTSDLEDGYVGSGKILKVAIAKYGIENFRKEILKFFGSEEDMYLEEAEYVTAEFVLRKDTYNLTEGGKTPGDDARSRGGKAGGKVTGPINGKYTRDNKLGIFSEESRIKVGKYLISEENLKLLLKNREMIKNSEKISREKKETFKRIKHQQSEKNSMFGTMWITNGKESTRIKKEDSIPNGWHKGRVQR